MPHAPLECGNSTPALLIIATRRMVAEKVPYAISSRRSGSEMLIGAKYKANEAYCSATFHKQQTHQQDRHTMGGITCASVLALLGFFALTTAADLNIITRSQWEAVEAKGPLSNLELPVGRVVVCHTAGSDCSDEDVCAQQVRNIQNFHMQKTGYDDIAYNFLVGNDGHVYEGRGWQSEGAFARGYNAGSMGIAFIGNYERALPSAGALEAARELMAQGVSLGKITEDYKLLGHRQLAVTSSPGNALYAALKQWPHWTARVRN